MFKIVRKQAIGPEGHLMEVEVPAIAAQVEPGHHVDLRVNPDGAALTMPVAGYDRQSGTITVAFTAQDTPSLQLSMLREGDDLFQIRGPLGVACTFGRYSKVVAVGQDLGVASLLPRAREYRNRGAYTIGILGFDSKDEVFWEEAFATICDELYVCTGDGSYGVKGRVTNPLRAVCEAHRDIERVVVIGRLATMKRVAKVAAGLDVPAVVSFDAIRQPVGSPSIFDAEKSTREEFDFARAPEVDANDVDFDKLVAKQNALAKAARNDRAAGT